MWCLPCQYKSKIPPRPISTVIERYKTFWTLRNNEDLQRSQNKSSMTFVQNPPAQLKTKLCTWPFAPPINSATTVKKHAELTRWRDKTSHPFTTCDTLVTLVTPVTLIPFLFISGWWCYRRTGLQMLVALVSIGFMWFSSAMPFVHFENTQCRSSLDNFCLHSMPSTWSDTCFFTFDVLNQKHIKEFSMFLGRV